MVKNEQDAEDLLQNSFTDIFSKLHTFKYQSSVGAWIKRIVINNCINFLKKRRLAITVYLVLNRRLRSQGNWTNIGRNRSNIEITIQQSQKEIEGFVERRGQRNLIILSIIFR